MNNSFASPLLENTVDSGHENATWLPSMEDQSWNDTCANGTDVLGPESGGPAGMYGKWLGRKPHLIAKIVLCFAYAVIIVISLFGNSLVCQVFIKHKEIHKSTGLLIFNLAISDILIILFNSPFALARFLSGQWLFGRIMCHVSRFAQYCSLHVSTLTLMAVAMDRHRVILHPMKPRLTHTRCLLIVAIIWALAVLLALPHAIYQSLFIFIGRDGVVSSHCLPSFPGSSNQVGKYVDLGTFILLYVVPLLVIVSAYSHLGKRLWVQNAVGDASARQLMAHYQKRKKSIRMLILIVMVFAVCWFPLNCYVVLISSAGIDAESVLFYAFHWFAMSSTCYNPFIYCWLNRSFRAKLRCILDWCTECLHMRRTTPVEQMQVQESHELQELQTSSLLRVPLAMPEPPIFEEPSLATGDDNSQISVQGDWDDHDPDISLNDEEEEGEYETTDPYFTVQVNDCVRREHTTP
ncbi:probable G-protein coupled receptor 83 [Perognathus longimembris pacificus]|uniref:probable G-protein coupled receptor 83 n=1 Tax=Perognathus longimembris pacificus TaxID=214514 RepID=UPI002019AA44|nr:probable G-protein coupled receptor 83 [Perognathus longimembris pacificus]